MKEALLKRKSELEQSLQNAQNQLAQATANVNMHIGALSEVNRQLAEFDKPPLEVTKDTVSDVPNIENPNVEEDPAMENEEVSEPMPTAA